MIHQICQRTLHFFTLFVGERHFTQTLLQFGTLTLVIVQPLFVLAQIYEVTAMLALIREPDVTYGEPHVQPKHETTECSPEKAFPSCCRHQADALPFGKFFHPGVFVMQVGQQTNGTSTVGTAGLHQRIGMNERLFVVEDIPIGRS